MADTKKLTITISTEDQYTYQYTKESAPEVRFRNLEVYKQIISYDTDVDKDYKILAVVKAVNAES